MPSNCRVSAYSWSVTTKKKSKDSYENDIYRAMGPLQDLEHVALYVFGRVYEYSALGIRITRISSKSQVKSQCVPSTEPTEINDLGDAIISPTEFEEWVQESSNEFSQETFDLAERNCVTWAGMAAKTLGVRPDPIWREIQRYIERNQETLQHLPYVSPGESSRNDWIRNTGRENNALSTQRACCTQM